MMILLVLQKVPTTSTVVLQENVEQLAKLIHEELPPRLIHMLESGFAATSLAPNGLLA